MTKPVVVIFLGSLKGNLKNYVHLEQQQSKLLNP